MTLTRMLAGNFARFEETPVELPEEDPDGSTGQVGEAEPLGARHTLGRRAG